MTLIQHAGIKDIPVIQQLANEIWQITYKDILRPDEISYMLQHFYSEASLQQQIAQHHSFFLIKNDEKPVGFASYSLLKDVTYKLHKLYVLPSLQSLGLGKLLLTHIITEIKNNKGAVLEVNVNRNNKAVHFYQKLGFTIIKEEDVDIGNGYFQNDYVLELKINI